MRTTNRKLFKCSIICLALLLVTCLEPSWESFGDHAFWDFMEGLEPMGLTGGNCRLGVCLFVNVKSDFAVIVCHVARYCQVLFQ